MRLLALIQVAFVAGMAVAQDETYEEADIVADQIMLDPVMLLFTSIKLSWNDASALCQTNYVRQELVTVFDDHEFSTLTFRKTLVFESMWLGLISSSPTSPEPTWVTCQPYSEDDYKQPFQRANNTFSSSKRCALLTSDFLWEWRDCSEPHGFACRGKYIDGVVSVPKKFFPKCGESDTNFCPLTNTSCNGTSEQSCFIPAMAQKPPTSASSSPALTDWVPALMMWFTSDVRPTTQWP